MIFVLLSSLSAGISSNLTKFATRTDPPDKVVFYHALYMTPMTLGPALFVWQWPTLEQLLWLALIGFLATLNQRCLSRALAAADATAVLPFLFMRLPFAAILGYAAFVEFPVCSCGSGAPLYSAPRSIWRGEKRASAGAFRSDVYTKKDGSHGGSCHRTGTISLNITSRKTIDPVT